MSGLTVMGVSTSRRIWKWLWVLAAVVAVIAGGELVILVVEEAGDLLLEASHALFVLIFQRVFGMPYAQAEGWAAWAGVGLLVALGVLGVWWLMPRFKAMIAAARQGYRETRSELASGWRVAPWYKKLFIAAGVLTLLFGFVMVI